jgi:hypothetical protein
MRTRSKVGALPPHPRDLSLRGPKLVWQEKRSPRGGELPSSFGHRDGARVASQQSPILRAGARVYASSPGVASSRRFRVLIIVKGTNR